MEKYIKTSVLLIAIMFVFSCQNQTKKDRKIDVMKEKASLTAKDILGNPNYLAMSYGGYRYADHSIEPTLQELKEDMKLLSAIGVKIVRTYKLTKPHASNLVKAISELKNEDPNFEMYVMLGVWINCKNAFSWENGEPIHNEESEDNAAEVERAVKLAGKFPDIIKIIAVGNEAMVKWATSYYVEPWVILKWVKYLQNLKKEGDLANDIWITSSDNFASWGGGGEEYHVEDLNELIKAVDYISMHTYPMHDTHYQPEFWLNSDGMEGKTDMEKIEISMLRAKEYAMMQYEDVKKYMESLGVNKPIHIGETGWASVSTGHYGPDGSKACDEYKEALYYKHMRDWTNDVGMSCFYFEGFDEPWKGGENSGNSEKHFGLFTVDGKAKYVLWDEVDKGTFKGLTRNGNSISKTYNGNKEALMKDVLVPPMASEVTIPH
ncbi:glycosyl hydrolase family 17 protein [Yeosuana sp. MJ-SS3]|uniref:Endo-1,3-beta-glucanase btgC n=1 Tax=Gilvirhabdus luticola TaxID=3079858 RepID=A0ABU3U5G8_9FLAO|nr:glycosyl hydrolase family 17 protein [Yeosuana sp. MJ-SS3]MDU8885654.1 glycosyl hydrolase family 17 protein [Yeosuana sp. MJ-SS3]